MENENQEWDLSKYPAHLEEMRVWANAMDDMPDGAFFALAEQTMGWDVEDWAELANYETKKT